MFAGVPILFVVRGQGLKAVTQVQSATGTTGATNAQTVTATLGSEPVAGNVLIAACTWSQTTHTRIATTDFGSMVWMQWEINNTVSGALWVFVGHCRTSGFGTTLTFSDPNAATNRPMVCVVAEYSGLNIRLDAKSSATGNSTTPSGGIPPNSLTSSDLAISFLGCQGQYATTGANPFSSPTNSYAIVAQQNTNNNTANNDRAICMMERFLTSAIPQGGGATITSNQWTGMGLTFYQTLAAG